MKAILLAAAIGSGLLVIGATAQHEEHHQDQAAPPPSQKDKGKPGMSGGMMSEMPQMMMGQQETARLADELLKSFAAVQSENDPAALKTKLEAHGALLKQLQSKVQGQSHMMEMMQHMMGGSSENNGKKK